ASSRGSRLRVPSHDPIACALKGCAPVGCGAEVNELGQEQGEFAFGEELRRSVFQVEERKWLAPIAPATKQPVAQLVADRALAEAFLCQPFDHAALGLRRGE